MSGLHEERPDDPRFSEAEYGRLQTEHARWENADRGAECDETLAGAGDKKRWATFVANIEVGAAATDLEWSAYVASDPTPCEVLDAFEVLNAGVAPSPDEGIGGRAIKLGGKPLAKAFALLCAVAMRRGRVPVAWSTGFIKWLFKDKGDVLDFFFFKGHLLRGQLPSKSAWAEPY